MLKYIYPRLLVRRVRTRRGLSLVPRWGVYLIANYASKPGFNNRIMVCVTYDDAIDLVNSLLPAPKEEVL